MIDIYEVVTKLIGPIRPVGDSDQDELRLANLCAMIELAGKIINDVNDVASSRGCVEGSRRVAGKLAYQFIEGLVDSVE